MKTLDHRDKVALVLQGGGARGAYHVGTLQAIAEFTGRRRSPFKIVCGASVGAINAASVAAAANNFQNGVRHLVKLWRSLSCKSIYDTRALPLLITMSRWAWTLLFGHLGFRVSGGFLDNTPLLHLLKREFDRQQLKRAIQTGSLHALCITASSYNEGMAITFFEGQKEIDGWTRARRRGERAVIGPEHLLASSALPFAFAPVQLQGGYFGDGALRLTSPLSPAIHTGADRILVIATRDSSPDPPNGTDSLIRPSIGEIAGHALDIVFNDNLESDHERMTRINHTLSLIAASAREKTSLRKIDTILLSPSQDLRKIARKYDQELPIAIRLLMRSLGSWGCDGRLESYLLFEAGYIGALLDLGYADAMERQDELRAFLAE